MSTRARSANSAGRASIGDVARAAGVSKQTVSNVMNNRPGYTEATKQRVLDAMASMSYKPRQAARSLRSRRSMLLGFHMHGHQLDINTGFTHTFVQSLVRVAAHHGYHLLVVTDADDDRLRPLTDLARSGDVDGLILSDLRENDPRPDILADARLPFATFGKLPSHLPQRWVDVDNRAGMAKVVDHLVTTGHRDIAYLSGDDGEYWTAERLDGFRTAMADRALDLREDWTMSGPRQRLREETRRLLALPERPTALVTDNDAIGADVINSIHATGLEAGRDVAVTGFGGGPITGVTDPTLSTVRVPVLDVAEAVVSRCLAAMSGDDDGEAGQYVPIEFVRGGSS